MANGDNGQGTAIVRPSDSDYNKAGAAIERHGFGSRELVRQHETHSTALAERAKAEVSAMFIMAMQNPRAWPTVWGVLIKECKRPSFAEAAIYRLKKGKKKNEETGQWEDNWIEGLTIGFARSALRAMGNADISEPTIYEDEEKRIVEVCAIDLECNVRQRRQVMVARSIERGSADGREVLGERKNSYGKTTYIVVPTDDEMEVKVASLVSKKRRDLILDMLPADLKDDCKATALAVRQQADKTDPDAAKKKMISAYMQIGVNADELSKYLGHPFEQVTADELEELRGVGAAIKDGETNWAEALREKIGDAPKPEKPADKVGDKLKDKLASAATADKTSKPRTAGAIEVRRKALFASMQWRDGVAEVEDLKATVEAVGPGTWGWWLFKAGTQIALGEAVSEAEAKAAAIAEAAKTT